MKKLKKFFGKLSGAFSEGAVTGSFVGVILFYAYLLVYILFTHDSTAVTLGAMLLVMNFIGVFCAVFIRVHKNFHSHDQEIIGSNFVGISKKCRIFAQALDDLFSRHHRKALDGFKLIESDYADQLENGEAAINAFYIGRCYELMGYYPNALKYYAQAKNLGFSDKVLPFLTARCTGANGDTGEAVELYMEVLSDRKSPFRNYVRTDIGRMYVRNDQPEEALKWYDEAINKRQNYSEALGGAAIATALLGQTESSEKLFRMAILNRINDPVSFTAYYRTVRGSVKAQEDIRSAGQSRKDEN